MKRIGLGLAIVLALTLSACNDTGGGNSNAASTEGSGDLAGYAITDYNGIGLQRAVKEDDRGKSEARGDLLNGEKHGAWVTYHKKNGLLETITNYHQGVKHGLFMRADDKGQIKERCFYENGMIQGKRYKYNRSRVAEDADYIDGKLNGTRKTFYDNGKLQEEGTFKDGKREGKAIYYNQQEEKILEYEYKGGEMVNEKKFDPPVPKDGGQ